MASLRQISAMHKFESNNGFVAELPVSVAKFFTNVRQRSAGVDRRHAHACIATAVWGVRVPRMFEAHFQSFDDSSERAHSAKRVAELRAELKRRGLAGFMVPRADRQQNEYLPASEERLAWLTGFTGSAGAAIVLSERAALFADGRYTVQA